MKSMNISGQQIDGAAKASGRVRAAKASLATGTAANDARQSPALLTDLHESTSAAIDAAGRHSLIAEAAYLRAERRGFSGGCSETDWLEAEREVDGQLIGRGVEGARCGD